MDIKIFKDDEKNKKFNKKGTELVILTDGTFRLEDNIDSMKLILKGLILESELIELLNSRGITSYTLSEIEEYANKWQSEIDVNILLRSIELYKMLDKK